MVNASLAYLALGSPEYWPLSSSSCMLNSHQVKIIIMEKVYFWRVLIYPISWQIVTHSIIDMTWTLKKPKEAYPCSCTCCIHFHGRVRPKCFPNVSLALLTYSYFANHLEHMILTWHRLKHLNWVQANCVQQCVSISILSATKKAVDGHRKQLPNCLKWFRLF